MTQKVDLALMCKSHNYEIDPYKLGYRVGNWVIAKKRRNALIGGTVILTESQKSTAYLGGQIIGFASTDDGKCEVIFAQDHSLVGNEAAVGHKGWGSGRGVCYI